MPIIAPVERPSSDLSPVVGDVGETDGVGELDDIGG